ncbi:uncharacterized protein LOC107771083 [Nicotiana tabacum]|uniref:Uncharacterized protein LOC107771083 n=1 Tax=Nicotiana tabacum TaxID=4097 RepID=A0AC58TQA0_TOBAC
MDQDISRWHIWDDLARDFVRQFQYNIDIRPDRNSLTNLRKKPSESFREYAIKWREQASRVKPQMDEVEMVTIFLQAQEPDYFQNMMSSMGKPFAEAIKIEEMMDLLQPIPQNRQNPESPAYQRGVHCAYHSGAEGHSTDNCWTLKKAVENLIEQVKIVLRDEEAPNVTNNPLPAHNNGPVIGMIFEDKEFDPALKAIIAIADAERKPKATLKQEKGEKKTKTVKIELEKKVETKAEMAPPKNEVLYIPRGHQEKPLVVGISKKFEVKKGTPTYVPKGDYVVRGTIKRPRLNEPVIIGRVPQKPITDPSAVPWNYQQTLVTYKGKEITGELPGNTFAGKNSDVQEVNNAIQKRFPPKKPVSAEEAEAFFQKMKMPDYEVVDQLRKYPEQVSMLSLLKRSAEYQKTLVKTLNEAYVPAETSVEQLERMAERFFAVSQISFSKNDLPLEGVAHNKALHLTVKCEGFYVKRVMVDGGSGVDICPLSTLQRMEIGTGKIRPNNIYVRSFDGIKKDTIGEIDLAFEVVVADQYEEGSPCPQPFLSNASIMVAKAMVKYGFKPGKGFGKALQGISEPITLSTTEKFFGIGFNPTPEDEDWADERKREGWVLPQPLPHLYQTFVNPKYSENGDHEAFTAEEIEDICGSMRQMLYETNMVQLGEEPVNLGTSEEIRETKISIHTDEKTQDAIIQLLFEFKDVFAWSYDNMPGLSVDLVVHCQFTLIVLRFSRNKESLRLISVISSKKKSQNS